MEEEVPFEAGKPVFFCHIKPPSASAAAAAAQAEAEAQPAAAE